MLSLVETVDAHNKYGLPLAFEPEDGSLVTGGFDGSIRVWSANNWGCVSRSSGHDQSLNCGGITALGHLVTGSTDSTVRTWELPTLTPVCVLEGHRGTVAALATHPLDGRFASGSYDATVRIWGSELDKDPVVIEGESGNITSVVFLGEGNEIAFGGLGDSITIQSIVDEEEGKSLGGHGQAVVGISTVGSADVVWSAGYNGKLYCWSRSDWGLLDEFDIGSEQRPTGIALHPNKPVIAITREGGFSLRSTEGDELLASETEIKGIYRPVWSPDGTFLAVGGADGNVRVFG